jgi:nitrogen fixation protein NifU and related proteins
MQTEDSREITATVLDHARHPRNFGPLENAMGNARITGPCGDTMEFWVRVEDGRITRVAFTTDGCGSSLACGSMATCLAEGRPLKDAAAVGQKEILDALGGLPREIEHCALLAADTLQAACADLLEYGLRGPGRGEDGGPWDDARGAGPEGGHAGRSGERLARGTSGGGPGCV